METTATTLELTDEEWSRVLSAHAGGQLRRQGGLRAMGMGSTHACLIQAARVEAGAGTAMMLDPALADWFDKDYEKTWTPERLLAEHAEFEAQRGR